MIVECEGQPRESLAPKGVPLEILCDENPLLSVVSLLKGVHRHPEGVPTEPAVLRKRSIRFSFTETRITFVGDVLDGTSCIVPIFARRCGVKTSRLEGNLREIGFADLSAWGPCGLRVASIDVLGKPNVPKYIPVVHWKSAKSRLIRGRYRSTPLYWRHRRRGRGLSELGIDCDAKRYSSTGGIRHAPTARSLDNSWFLVTGQCAHPDKGDQNCGFRAYRRQPGHYTRFGVTFRVAVIRTRSLDRHDQARGQTGLRHLGRLG
jgi:hypothetical protein